MLVTFDCSRGRPSAVMFFYLLVLEGVEVEGRGGKRVLRVTSVRAKAKRKKETQCPRTESGDQRAETKAKRCAQGVG